MAFFINKQPAWLVKALNRSPKEDSGVPNFIPDTISPKVDIFGWEALQRIRTDSATALVGVESVFPTVTPDWPAVLGGSGGLVPDSVALRLMWGLHIQHTDTGADPAKICWFGLLDREGGSTGLPTESGTSGQLDAGGLPNDTPLVCTRVFVLRPREQFVGRIRNLGVTFFLSMFYSWIDLEEGEYLSGQLF